jgi:DNA-binding SARP family transcriptional activator/tetratricopeptide (TPR) repeat protein
MRTSLLDTVDLTLGAVAADVTEDEARTFIEASERQGLFGRRGSHGRYIVRSHPLVREFLRSRLIRSVGATRVREIHGQIARKAESVDWEIAARHYQASGEDSAARRVVSESLEPILAKGSYAAAQGIAASLERGLEELTGLVLQSRLAQQRAAVHEALDLAERAAALEPNSTAAALNLSAARTLAGDVPGALVAARRLELSGHEEMAGLGRAVVAAMATSVEGSLDVADLELARLCIRLELQGATHYLGVALLDRSQILIAKGDFAAALDLAAAAISYLQLSSAGNELVSAHLAHADALAFLGDIQAARAEITAALSQAHSGQALELAADIAEMEALVGESARAWPLVAAVGDRVAGSDLGELVSLARVFLSIQDGDLEQAELDAARLQHLRPVPVVAFEAKRLLAEGLLHALSHADGVPSPATEGAHLAARQGARFWATFGETLSILADRTTDPSETVLRVLAESPSVVSSLAELILERLPDLRLDAGRAVSAEAERRPWRWRSSVRRALDGAEARNAQVFAALLERIGEAEDIGRLRAVGRRLHTHLGTRPGLTLARRLAERVFVEDLGRVQILIGERVVDGADVRRKVLALLCLLLSRPRFVSTREEVLDSLWPEHDPSSALNSLNQTVYFLRRVFEPNFRDDETPGYVGQDGETIWLDAELIDCRSRRCVQIIRGMPRDPTPEGAVELATQYRGRFALDFAYDDWAAPFRDALHASYLRVVEHAVRLDLDSGHFERGTFIAERASEVDPESEEIQAALVRLYRLSGAHAAAAEQYAHYAHGLRDLGIEPPALADV